ncbi:MAG TPA: AarF/ABC1/UbiB kinase family protein [Solirubrobacteraceae bacterium]|jgi:predicted unusual protein kinase regulating ubiquinone biosynthesis (AarF/ABC1/UbiB family)
MAEFEPPAGAGGGAEPFGEGIASGRIRRTVPLVKLTTRTAAEATVAGLRGKLSGSEGTEFHARTAERYAELLGRSKGALMKAGQMLSFVSSGPVVPPDMQPAYQTAFARLFNDAPPMPAELAQMVLERELGRRTSSVFAEFDWQPLAAASIGQVHSARLRDGRAVAVKIQYPGVAEAILCDLKNTQLLATFLSVMTGLSPRQVSADIRGAAREIGERIVEELDYEREASNQEEFAACYRGHPFIHIPEVLGELSTGRVLTQELRVGRSWDEALRSDQRLRDRWAETLWRFVYGSYLRFGLLNIDPHPGNFLFHDDGSMSFLDFGCVQRYGREEVGLYKEIVRASLRDDASATWRLCVEAGLWRASDPVTPEEVLAYWREPFRYVWDEQPFAFTPEYAASWIECRCSPTGPAANAICHMTMPDDSVAWPRIEVSLSSMLADLGASNEWRAIQAEYDGAAPLTELGKLDHAHFALHCGSGEPARNRNHARNASAAS